MAREKDMAVTWRFEPYLTLERDIGFLALLHYPYPFLGIVKI